MLTVYEVGIGLRGTNERERYERVTDSMSVVPLSWSTSRTAVGIQRTLRSRGEEIGSIDALIAATAIERVDARVLTRNVGEFERVEAIDVETY